jgi:arylsulfatase A-like enzyme
MPGKAMSPIRREDLKPMKPLQNEHPELVGKAVAVRDREWTYVWRRYGRAELYRRASDPDERVNLAQRPEHVHTIARLHQAMLHWLVDTADAIPMPPDPRFPTVELSPPGVQR